MRCEALMSLWVACAAFNGKGKLFQNLDRTVYRRDYMNHINGIINYQ